MADKFNDFPEIPDIAAASQNMNENQSNNSKISSDNLKKLVRQMKKQRKAQMKLQKRIHKLSKTLAVCNRVSEPEKDGAKKFKKDSSTNASPQKEKTFLWKLGDAVVKAIPGILSTAVTVIATILIGQPPKPLGKFEKAVA